MKVKLKKISTQSFIVIFSVINVISGFILGALVTAVSLLSSDQQNPPGAIEVWAILIFPLLNGILGLVAGAFMTGMYNFFAKMMGGIELEFENIQ